MAGKQRKKEKKNKTGRKKTQVSVRPKEEMGTVTDLRLNILEMMVHTVFQGSLHKFANEEYLSIVPDESVQHLNDMTALGMIAKKINELTGDPSTSDEDRTELSKLLKKVQQLEKRVFHYIEERVNSQKKKASGSQVQEKNEHGENFVGEDSDGEAQRSDMKGPKAMKEASGSQVQENNKDGGSSDADESDGEARRLNNRSKKVVEEVANNNQDSDDEENQDVDVAFVEDEAVEFIENEDFVDEENEDFVDEEELRERDLEKRRKLADDAEFLKVLNPGFLDTIRAGIISRAAGINPTFVPSSALLSKLEEVRLKIEQLNGNDAMGGRT